VVLVWLSGSSGTLGPLGWVLGSLNAKFYVFDALEGGVDTERSLPPLNDMPLLHFSIARRWLEDMLEAVQFVQQQRIVHLDIKLSNILVDLHRRLVLCDFGCAARLSPVRDTARDSSKSFIPDFHWLFLCRASRPANSRPTTSTRCHKGQGRLQVYGTLAPYAWHHILDDTLFCSRALDCVHQESSFYTVQRGEYFHGNMAHMSPELWAANMALADDATESVTVDLAHHMAFAIAVAMVELIALPGVHPIPDYPCRYFDPATRRMSFNESHLTALPTSQQLQDAGYVCASTTGLWAVARSQLITFACITSHRDCGSAALRLCGSAALRLCDIAGIRIGFDRYCCACYGAIQRTEQPLKRHWICSGQLTYSRSSRLPRPH
jgi:serine/threonine protein kinase